MAIKSSTLSARGLHRVSLRGATSTSRVSGSVFVAAAPRQLHADFRERLTCLIDPQVACMDCVVTFIYSEVDSIHARASRAHKTHWSPPQPGHGLRRLGEASFFQERVVGPLVEAHNYLFRRDLNIAWCVDELPQQLGRTGPAEGLQSFC